MSESPEITSALETPTLTSQATQTPEAPATDAPAEAAPPAEFTPLTAEELGLDETGAPFLELANEAKLPKELAVKFLEKHNSVVQEVSEAALKTWRDTNAKWVEQVNADPEIGGTKLQAEVLPAVSRAIDKLGGDELRAALDLTGAGNNPAIIRALYRASQFLVEPTKPAMGAPPAQKVVPSAAEALYPQLAKGN